MILGWESPSLWQEGQDLHPTGMSHFNTKSPCYWNCYPLPRKTSWTSHLSLPFPLRKILLGTGTVRSSSSFSLLSFTSQVFQPWLGRASEKSGHSGLAHSWVHHSRVCLWCSEVAPGHPKGLHWPSRHSRLIQLTPWIYGPQQDGALRRQPPSWAVSGSLKNWWSHHMVLTFTVLII